MTTGKAEGTLYLWYIFNSSVYLYNIYIYMRDLATTKYLCSCV